jgi:glycosyltransferase involved in cell wall biosynthesis
MELPFVSAIVPCYNNSAQLQKCLSALYFQSYPYDRYEVIVVDNGSTEDLFTLCQQFPNVRYCYERKRGSYAARNKGLKLAQGEVIAFTDSDCLPDRDWLTQGVRALAEADIVAGHIEFFFQQALPNPVEYADALSHLNQALYVTQGYGATGNLFVWARVFREVGPFNGEMTHLGDREWGQRATAAGNVIVYSEAAWVGHPARSNLRELTQKVTAQARAKRQLEPVEFLRSLKLMMPLSLRFYRSVWGDSNLPTIGSKLQFISVIHWLKWVGEMGRDRLQL